MQFLSSATSNFIPRFCFRAEQPNNAHLTNPENLIDKLEAIPDAAREIQTALEKSKALSKKLAQSLVEKMGGEISRAEYQELAKEILQKPNTRLLPAQISIKARQIEDAVTKALQQNQSETRSKEAEAITLDLDANTTRLSLALKRANVVSRSAKLRGFNAFISGLGQQSLTWSNAFRGTEHQPETLRKEVITAVTEFTLQQINQGQLDPSSADFRSQQNKIRQFASQLMGRNPLAAREFLAQKQSQNQAETKLKTPEKYAEIWPSLAAALPTPVQTKLLGLAEAKQWQAEQLNQYAELYSSINLSVTRLMESQPGLSHLRTHQAEKFAQHPVGQSVLKLEKYRHELLNGTLDLTDNTTATQIAALANSVKAVTNVRAVDAPVTETNQAEVEATPEGKKAKIERLESFLDAVDAASSQNQELAQAILTARQALQAKDVNTALPAVQILAEAHLRGLWGHARVENETVDDTLINAEDLANNPNALVEALRYLELHHQARLESTKAALEGATGLEEASAFMADYLKNVDAEAFTHRAVTKYEEILQSLQNSNSVAYETFKNRREEAITNIANDLAGIEALGAYLKANQDELDASHPLLQTFNDLDGVVGWSNFTDENLQSGVEAAMLATTFVSGGFLLKFAKFLKPPRLRPGTSLKTTSTVLRQGAGRAETGAEQAFVRMRLNTLSSQNLGALQEIAQAGRMSSNKARKALTNMKSGLARSLNVPISTIDDLLAQLAQAGKVRETVNPALAVVKMPPQAVKGKGRPVVAQTTPRPAAVPAQPAAATAKSTEVSSSTSALQQAQAALKVAQSSLKSLRQSASTLPKNVANATLKAAERAVTVAKKQANLIKAQEKLAQLQTRAASAAQIKQAQQVVTRFRGELSRAKSLLARAQKAAEKAVPRSAKQAATQKPTTASASTPGTAAAAAALGVTAVIPEEIPSLSLTTSAHAGTILPNAGNNGAQAPLPAGKEAKSAPELEEKIAATTIESFAEKSDKIDEILTQYANYQSGQWRDIVKKVAALDDITFPEGVSDEMLEAYGKKLQAYIRQKLNIPVDQADKNLADGKPGRHTLENWRLAKLSFAPDQFLAQKDPLQNFKNKGNWQQNNIAIAQIMGLDLSGASVEDLLVFGKSFQAFAYGRSALDKRNDGKIGPGTLRNSQPKLTA